MPAFTVSNDPSGDRTEQAEGRCLEILSELMQFLDAAQASFVASVKALGAQRQDLHYSKVHFIS